MRDKSLHMSIVVRFADQDALDPTDPHLSHLDGDKRFYEARDTDHLIGSDLGLFAGDDTLVELSFDHRYWRAGMDAVNALKDSGVITHVFL